MISICLPVSLKCSASFFAVSFLPDTHSFFYTWKSSAQSLSSLFSTIPIQWDHDPKYQSVTMNIFYIWILKLFRFQDRGTRLKKNNGIPISLWKNRVRRWIYFGERLFEIYASFCTVHILINFLMEWIENWDVRKVWLYFYTALIKVEFVAFQCGSKTFLLLGGPILSRNIIVKCFWSIVNLHGIFLSGTETRVCNRVPWQSFFPLKIFL